MTSNLRVDIWSSYLQHYQDRIVVDFLRYGWPINYKSPVLASSTFKNHPSALRDAVQLSSYISKELSYQSAFGPFRCNPFSSNCVISPLLCVPKRGSADLRFVHDLSFPEGISVNDGNSNELYLDQPFKLRLPGIDRLVDSMPKGKAALYLKRISSALSGRFQLTQRTTLCWDCALMMVCTFILRCPSAFVPQR